MSSRLILFALVVQLTLVVFVREDCFVSGSKMEPRIIGGQPASFGEFPYQVMFTTDVNSRTYLLCGGSIIESSVIVTAAHCVYNLTANNGSPNNVTDMLITAGNIYSDKESSHAQYSSVRKAIMHPQYDAEANTNDLAILILTTPFTFNQYVQPVSLPCPLFNYEDIVCVVTGWGKTDTENDMIAKVLQFVQLNTISIKECQKMYIDEGNIFPSQICAYTPNKDSCQGDSGGPMICNCSLPALAGIVSMGIGCAQEYPGIYTRVTSFVNYIKRVVYEETGTWLEPACPTGKNSTNASFSGLSKSHGDSSPFVTSSSWEKTTTSVAQCVDNINTPLPPDEGPMSTPVIITIGAVLIALLLSIVCFGSLMIIARVRPNWLPERVVNWFQFGRRSEYNAF